MKKLTLLFLFAVAALTSKSQGVDTSKVFSVVEVQPSFPGGYQVFTRYIANNIRYPANAIKNRIEGRVYVSFVVDIDGSIKQIKVLRPVSPELDAEAIRIISSSPKWKPGMNNGYPVKASFSMPITFRLSLPIDTAAKKP